MINPKAIGSMTQLLQIGSGRVRLLDPPEPKVCRDCKTTFMRSQTRVVLCDACREENTLKARRKYARAALADPIKKERINALRREQYSTPEGQKKKKDQRARWLANESPEKRKERLANMRKYGKSYQPTRRALRYGLTTSQVEELLARQGGRCVICSTTEPKGRYNEWAIDHCHKTGEVRGLLCNSCNTSLGGFEDDTLRLQKAIDYLNGGNRDLVSAVLNASNEEPASC